MMSKSLLAPANEAEYEAGWNDGWDEAPLVDGVISPHPMMGEDYIFGFYVAVAEVSARKDGMLAAQVGRCANPYVGDDEEDLAEHWRHGFEAAWEMGQVASKSQA